VQVEADRVVLKHHAPVGVVVDEALDVIQFRGRTTPYLEPSPGKASFNVLKLARNGLGIELRTLIRSAKEKNAPVKQDGVVFDLDGHRRILILSVSPLGEKSLPWNDRHLLILFEDVTARRIADSVGPSRAKQKGGASTRELDRTRRERTSAQEALRAAMESEDALREQFQSANEEILSANEELQSTNEELETSKEELQSTNEELNTLNDELRHKNIELHDLSNDLSNFLNSTKIPIVMLDRELRVRRLTPFAGKLLKVVASDIGRPISDIKLNIRMPDLESVIRQVMENLQPVERDVVALDDFWHALHILPYRTQDDKIDGVVLALQDIDAIKSANEQLQRSSDLLRSIINTVREPFLVLDSDLRIIATNDAYQRTFKISSRETVNRFLYHLGDEEWNIPKLRALLEQALATEGVVTEFEIEQEFPSIGRRMMLLNARTLVQTNERQAMILLAIEDVTERKFAEAALIQSAKLAASGRLAASLAHEINNPLQAVMNLMTLLGQATETNPENRKYATLAAKELERVVHLVRQALGFYRESSVAADLNLEDVFDSVLSLYATQIEAAGIVIEKRYSFNGLVKGYPGEIRQIFSTLLVNAMEASSKGGRISVRAHDSFNWKSPAVRGVRFVVADSGAGIPSENMNRIYEPFFTTKGERGTGIGLWVTRAIVERLGGSIRLRSKTELGRSGSFFSVFLPRQEPK
jgi:two-component system, chemotaxis family, CheB/CheR fusion protein